MATHSNTDITTEQSTILPETQPSIALIIVLSVVGVFLLLLLSVGIIVCIYLVTKKSKSKQKGEFFKNRVETVFNESLKEKGNAMLREDYERYALSDVSPLDDKPESSTRKQSETAAYDEVPYSPDDVANRIKETTDEKLNRDAKDKRRDFSESRSNGLDSGISSIASYGKAPNPTYSAGNESSYKLLRRQSSSVDTGITEGYVDISTGRQISGSGEDGLLEIPVDSGDSVFLTINEANIDSAEEDESENIPVDRSNYARSNSSFDNGEEGVTRL